MAKKKLALTALMKIKKLVDAVLSSKEAEAKKKEKAKERKKKKK
jgi:hypothetical protein